MSKTKNYSRLTDFDIALFKEGKHFRLYDKLGCHYTEVNGEEGYYFAVWAPNAKEVSVIGSFNGWNSQENPLFVRWDSSGIWEGFIPSANKGDTYKYKIISQQGESLEKADPFALYCEQPPRTASVIWDTYYEWSDKEWMDARKEKAGKPQPYSVYEVHIGSWKKIVDDNNRSLNYTEQAVELVEYVKEMGYTHVELMPIMEYPYYPSWGYQITGYFAPSSRFGNPQEFMLLVEEFHKAGISVILDWVPSHFPTDAHGLQYFDGTHLFEHADPRKGFHPDWKSSIFNYGRNEVKSFLISNALFWLDRYHIDGLRVDAVASMLYLDYSRKEGEWIPNIYGGNENLEAISFLQLFNETVYAEYPDTVTIAEESTSYSGVSRPTSEGGLGFGQKWMMGWMHDTLNYFKREAVYRKYHQNELTFSFVYAFTENFMLPLSHDEVVYGKGAIIDRMSGDEWQRFAQLRLLYGYMMAHPGTMLNFMGNEFGQTSEWSFEDGLEWWLLDHEPHQKIQKWVKNINSFYKENVALFEKGFEKDGFEWVDYGDAENSVLVFMRKANEEKNNLLIVCNFTPVTRSSYRIGTPSTGQWQEVLNSDAAQFGGGDNKNKTIKTEKIAWHGKKQSIEFKMAPFAIQIFKKK